MSSLDFCVCGGSKNQNQELCGECRMAEIEAMVLRHTWEEDFSDADFPDSAEKSCKCGMAITRENFEVCNRCYSVACHQKLEEFVKSGDEYYIAGWAEIMKNDPKLIPMYKCSGCKSWLDEEDLEYHDSCKLDEQECSKKENEWLSESDNFENDPLFNGDLL